MIAWVVAGLVAFLVLMLAVVAIAWGAVAQLVRVQAAILAHFQANEAPSEIDLALYLKTGFVSAPDRKSVV